MRLGQGEGERKGWEGKSWERTAGERSKELSFERRDGEV